jgi:uncharacterized damage-inducible protein DinB
MSKTIKSSIIDSYKKIQKGTEFVLRAIPQTQLDFKPNERMRRLEDLAFHIATLPVGSIILAESNFKEFPPLDVLLKAMEDRIGNVKTKNFADIFTRASEHFIQFIHNKTEEELIHSTYQSFLMREPASYFEGYLNMITHLIQHRGTLFVYLRLLEIPVSMMQYFGIKEL